MIAPDDMLVAAIASSVRRAPRRRRPRLDRGMIAQAHAAWRRLRLELFAGVRPVDIS